MSYLNEKWTTFRTAVEVGAITVALAGTGAWSFVVAAAERGYKAVGSEILLTIGAGVLAGIIAHKIFNKVEARLNEQFAAEARRNEEIRRANKARMFTIGAEQRRHDRFHTFTVGD